MTRTTRESLIISGSDAKLFHQFGFGPQSTVPFATIHQAFIHHAIHHPSDIALLDLSRDAGPSREVTYGELLRQSQFVATQLKSSGVKPENRVLLLVKRSAEMVAGILGVLMAGAQYIPMDGGVVPDQTLQRAVEQSMATVALCLEPYKERLRSLATMSSVLGLEELLQSEACSRFDLGGAGILCDGSNSSGCYIIYTSGTSGEPKGVDVTHKNVTNILCHSPGNLGISRGSKVGQMLSVSFDMGAWEILGSMCNGATLVLRGSDWCEALRRIDSLICTPSILSRFSPDEFPNIRCVATAGEPCPQSLADKWAASGAAFYNCCGPTEITIINTMQKHTAGRPLTIGKPTPNNNVYILNEDKAPCRIGDIGTIWAGGAGVTRGYVGQPDRTRERYHYDRFVHDGRSMMYNTGDLARWLPDGSLETFGRDDDQVKIRGFRVELDGVSACLASCAEVQQATALIVSGELTGIVTPRRCSLDTLKKELKGKLPYYAIPANWHTLDDFPLTPNGKVDKRALVSQVESRAVSRGQPEDRAPATTEKREVRPSIISAASSSLSSLQKEPLPLPEKKHSKPWRGLRHRIFIVYRTLFSLVWLANITMLICFLTIPTIDRRHISTIAFVNLTVAVLVRQDMVINTLYTLCCSIPKSWPLAIRRRCAKIYHLGGVHSGAAVMAVAWYTGGICYNINAFATRSESSVLTITLSLMALSIFIGMIICAYPTIRKKYHNMFERVHRFAGWAALAIIWVQTMSSIRDQHRHQPAPGRSLGHETISTPSFWMLIVITLSIASSWVFLRTVPVESEVLSNHAIRLHFDYTVPVNGTFTRLSERPLLEWHSFATVPAPEAENGHAKGYSLVVSRAGDWTGRQIGRVPNRLYVRGVPTCGVMRIATLFSRLVLVATGSGIGPLLGHIKVPTCPFRLVWSTPNPGETFGSEIVDAVYNADPGAVVHDTKKQGRPDLVRLTWDAVKVFNAEAVVIISNEKLTKKVVYGMESRGVPAYGAIWDS
ncbi:putative NRPS-like enzyme [Aspergillus undulatus]|uniref:putative NRPS-like enzyme n=1 Tax=Aspergillus undulatus TaxID=1810928 RepID=UPI003CCD41D9